VATKTETAEAPKAPPKSKKMLIIIGAVVLVLVLAAGGGWFYISKQRAAAAAAEEGGEETVATVKPKTAPVFLPLDNMVVNLADPGGEKVAQVGITLELTDVKSTDKVKVYLPAIRSGILLLISQRTAEELLKREGKEKLAADILTEASRPFSDGTEEHTDDKKGDGPPKKKKKKVDKNAHDENPVRAVLFSSFIVQ
jgi:flagellar protein FliL